MYVRGIRGATVARSDNPEDIWTASRELLEQIMKNNPSLMLEDIASCVFSCTHDLHSAYPAKAARDLGWINVPLLCLQEMIIEYSLQKCIRILILWNTNLEQSQIKHVYLHEAKALRPDNLNI